MSGVRATNCAIRRHRLSCPGRMPAYVRISRVPARRLRNMRESIETGLATYGLRLLGDVVARVGDESEPSHLYLAGNAGGEMWDVFAASPESSDGNAHPLDRWTCRVLESLGREWNARVLFPFGGAPWHPFQQWARLAGCGSASPLGILMHPRFGVWCGYRGAFTFDATGRRETVEPQVPFACGDCAAKPCLGACPVGAVTKSGLDAPRCRAHVLSDAGKECRTGGCLARRACPVAAQWRQSSAQQAFHMAAFASGSISL